MRIAHPNIYVIRAENSEDASLIDRIWGTNIAEYFDLDCDNGTDLIITMKPEQKIEDFLRYWGELVGSDKLNDLTEQVEALNHPNKYVIYRVSHRQAPCFGTRERYDYTTKHRSYSLNCEDIAEHIQEIFPDIIEGDWVILNINNTDYIHRYEQQRGTNTEYVKNLLILQGTAEGKICE